jgi:hypothetical protein
MVALDLNQYTAEELSRFSDDVIMELGRRSRIARGEI